MLCDSDIHAAKYVLASGLQSWFADPTLPFQPPISEFPSHHHELLIQAIDEQSKIGWHQATLGYLSQTWQVAASVNMFESTSQQPSKGMAIIMLVLKALHTTTRDLWLSRNSSLHDRAIG